MERNKWRSFIPLAPQPSGHLSTQVNPMMRMEMVLPLLTIRGVVEKSEKDVYILVNIGVPGISKNPLLSG